MPLDELTDAAYQALADGFPEDCALRSLAGRLTSESTSTRACRDPAGRKGQDQMSVSSPAAGDTALPAPASAATVTARCRA